MALAIPYESLSALRALRKSAALHLIDTQARWERRSVIDIPDLHALFPYFAPHHRIMSVKTVFWFEEVEWDVWTRQALILGRDGNGSLVGARDEVFHPILAVLGFEPEHELHCNRFRHDSRCWRFSQYIKDPRLVVNP